jgi:hypothetical protein
MGRSAIDPDPWMSVSGSHPITRNDEMIDGNTKLPLTRGRKASDPILFKSRDRIFVGFAVFVPKGFRMADGTITENDHYAYYYNEFNNIHFDADDTDDPDHDITHWMYASILL